MPSDREYRYQRHEPDRTVLYGVLRENLSTFLEQANESGAGLPAYVVNELAAYLDCGILANGFVRLYCEGCRSSRLVAFSCKRRGVCPSCGARRMSNAAAHLVDRVIPAVPVRQWGLTLPFKMRYLLARRPALVTAALEELTAVVNRWIRKQARKRGVRNGVPGAVTVVQRFGGALNLKVHFHVLVLDGVYADAGSGLPPVFHQITPPSDFEVGWILCRVIRGMGRRLVKLGFTDWDAEPEELMDGLSAASIRHANATTYGGFPGFEDERPPGPRCARANGYSLNANVAVGGKRRERLELLCRYLLRPPIALERMIAWSEGRVAYRLRHPFADGSSHVVFKPLDLVARLAALVPPPRANLIRYYGVFAPRHRLRRLIVPKPDQEKHGRAAPESRRLMWADLLKRVFAIDVLKCEGCGGRYKVISVVSQPRVARKILLSLGLDADSPKVLSARAPPQIVWDEVQDCE